MTHFLKSKSCMHLLQSRFLCNWHVNETNSLTNIIIELTNNQFLKSLIHFYSYCFLRLKDDAYPILIINWFSK
jgi:hypothetical protein